jgi:hypothetical protein
MSIVEILPVHVDASGATYRAMVYLDGNQRMRLEAHVSDPLRRRMAAQASKALAWVKGHVRLPAGPLQDLMAGEPPTCGCDLPGEAFRSVALMASELGSGLYDAWEQWPEEDPQLVWSFDDWTGEEARLLPDLGTILQDEIGRLVFSPQSRRVLAAVARRPGPRDADLIRVFRFVLGLA